MDNDKLLNIPYVVHEGTVARLERANKRLWVLCLVIFLAFVGSNCYWIWYESQWEDVVTTTESYESSAEGGGVAIANGDGEVNFNGEG